MSFWQLSTEVWSFINITAQIKPKTYILLFKFKKNAWMLQRNERLGRRIAWNNFPGNFVHYFSENTSLTSGNFFFRNCCCRGRFFIFYLEKVLTCLLNDLPFSWDLFMSNDVLHFLNVCWNRSTYCSRHDRKAMDIIWEMAGNIEMKILIWLINDGTKGGWVTSCQLWRPAYDTWPSSSRQGTKSFKEFP